MPNEEPHSEHKRPSPQEPYDETEPEQRRQRAFERVQELEEQREEDCHRASVEEHLERETTDEDIDKWAKSALRSHVGIGRDRPPQKAVLFFVETAPPSNRGAACQLPSCKDKIKEGAYRIAVHPGMNNYYGNADLYHVKCFEKLVDFSQSAYLDRIMPVHRNSVNMREIKSAGILDGHYLLDGGAERLVLEWKVAVGKLMDQRDGVTVEPIDPDFGDLLRKSGSAGFKPEKPPNMTSFEFHNLSHRLAPIESEGDGDMEEWNLFEEHFPLDFKDLEDLQVGDSLSQTLRRWEASCILATRNADDLTDEGKKLKEKMGEKAIRAIKRLSSVPMPNFQAAFLGRR